MTKGKKFIEGLSKTLFWDVDINTIDPEKHAPYVVERVLSRGTMEDFQLLKKYYGKDKIGTVASKLRYMDKIVLSFCVNYFKIPKEKFRCFTERHLHPTHWNY